MWKKITYLLFILGICIPSFAKPIKSSEASLLANRFLSSQGIVATTTTLDSISGGGTTYMFYMNVANKGGYVLLAADDRILPVLGYSNNSNFSLRGAPSNILKWIEGYKKEIRYALSHIQQADAETQKEWDVLRGIVQKPSNGRVASVPPLLQTTWDQDPYYNALCPYDNTANERAVVGCVATAMSQVMKYHRYPATGSGFHSYSDPQYGLQSANFAATTYNWASMPNSVRSANSAVATLCYHAGVAVDMTYGISSTGGSGAYTAIATSPITNCAEYALKTYFGYDPSTLRGAIMTDYTATTWVNLLKAELDASRPIMYAGSGNQGGHSFVCDGYDNSNRFHFNWGWSGNSDGYFVTNALNPSALGTGGGSGGFNSDQDVIIGIKPIVTGGGGTSGTTTLGLNSALSLSATTVQYLSSFSVTAAITNTGANAFNGDFMACAFSGNTFVDGIDTLRGRSLPAGQSTGTLTFTSSGSFVLIPANYTVSIYYRPTGGATWIPVATRNGNLNETTLTIQNTDNISLYAPITGPATYFSTQPCTVTCNILNGNTTSYYGDLALRLYDLQGNYVAEINSYTGVNLPANNYFARNLSFATSSLDVPPSTYILAMTYSQNGYNYLVGSGNYLNPKIITVVAPGLNADSYEPNNTITTAYTLTTLGSGNFLSTATNGSNFHVGNDVDFYKVNLPAGYSYTINSRLQDSYSSTDGGNYTVDALYSYSLDNGATFSDTYDDTLSAPIVINNGGTIMFQVAPWTQGITGIYKLDVPIVRGPVSTQSEIAGIKTSLFPNPTTGIVSLSAPMLSGGIISIINSQGQIVMLQNQSATLEKLDVSSLATGVYFVKLQGKEKTIQLKLVKE